MQHQTQLAHLSEPVDTEVDMPPMEADPAMRAVLADAQGVQIQAAIVLAKRFPRDEKQSMDNLLAACSRKSLAHKALYAFPKGETTVTGPTIRLAEAMAARWGNMNFGTIQLNADDVQGVSTMLAYAWDLQSNAFTNRVFRVRHSRKANGKVVRITDPMEVMSMESNMSSRKLRQCILAVIPVDVQDELMAACEATILQDIGANLPQYLDQISVDFATKFKVTVPMLEKRVGHNLDACKPQEVLVLQKLLRGLEDGFMKPHEVFPDIPPPATSPDAPPTKAQTLTDKYTAKGDAAAAAKVSEAKADTNTTKTEKPAEAPRKRGRPKKGGR